MPEARALHNQGRVSNMKTLTPLPRKQGESITMGFVDAMREIIGGKRVARISWGNTDYCLMKDGWISIYTKGAFHAWKINDGDISGEDWFVVK